MSKLPEWCGEHHEESRGHDKTVLVHRQIMVDAMEQEMQSDADSVVGKIAGLELAAPHRKKNRID